MIDEYVPKIGEYVRHKYSPDIKGVVQFIGESGIEVHINSHDGSLNNFKVFIGNIYSDRATFREHKINDILCQEK